MKLRKRGRGNEKREQTEKRREERRKSGIGEEKEGNRRA